VAEPLAANVLEPDNPEGDQVNVSDVIEIVRFAADIFTNVIAVPIG
jgi:hypothetical protein